MTSVNSNTFKKSRQEIFQPAKTQQNTQTPHAIFCHHTIFVVQSFFETEEFLYMGTVCKIWKNVFTPNNFFAGQFTRTQFFLDICRKNYSKISTNWKTAFEKTLPNITSLTLLPYFESDEVRLKIFKKTQKIKYLTIYNATASEIQFAASLPLQEAHIHYAPSPLNHQSTSFQSFWNNKSLKKLTINFKKDLFNFNIHSQPLPSLESLECFFQSDDLMEMPYDNLFEKFPNLTSLTLKKDTICRSLISHVVLGRLTKLRHLNLHHPSPLEFDALRNAKSLQKLEITSFHDLLDAEEDALLQLMSESAIKTLNYYTMPSYSYISNNPNRIFNIDGVFLHVKLTKLEEVFRSKYLTLNAKHLTLIINVDFSEKFQKNKICSLFNDYVNNSVIGYEQNDEITMNFLKGSVDTIRNLKSLKRITLYLKHDIASGSDGEKIFIYFLEQLSNYIDLIDTTADFIWTPNILQTLKNNPLPHCKKLAGPFLYQQGEDCVSIPSKDLKKMFPNYLELDRPFFYDDNNP